LVNCEPEKHLEIAAETDESGGLSFAVAKQENIE
jgi:hypothetical protein